MTIRYDRREILQCALTGVGLSAAVRLLAQTPPGDAPTGIVLSPSIEKPKGARKLAESDMAGYVMLYFKDETHSVYFAISRANTNINVDRLNASGQRVSLDTPTTNAWFNTDAFVLQPNFQFGNAARNSIIGPAGFSLDSNVQKNFRMPWEGHELQFRWEAYNLLNHPVLGFPNTNFSSPAFGTISSTTGSMRQMQFALKYVF